MLTMMDEYVRLGMLNYPTLFPDRLRVLAHSFLVLGNGVEWMKSGVLSLKDYKHDEMRYDDLEDDYFERHFRREDDDPNDPFFQRMKARRAESNARDRAIREKRAASMRALGSLGIRPCTTALSSSLALGLAPRRLDILRKRETAFT